MKNIAIRLAGLVLLLAGLTMAGWLAYNQFVHPDPGFQATTADTPRSPYRGLVMFLGIAAVGGTMLFGKAGPANPA